VACARVPSYCAPGPARSRARHRRRRRRRQIGGLPRGAGYSLPMAPAAEI